MLAKLGQFLMTRFPEKVTVTTTELLTMRAQIDVASSCLSEHQKHIDVILQRLSIVEANAVHKDAVQDLITVVKSLKDEYVSLKASLGMSRIGDADIRAMLSGEPIQGDNQ
jgi:hypothetical protein